MSTIYRQPLHADNIGPGPYLAKVVGHLDPSYMGNLEVQLQREVGGDVDREGQIYTVQYMSPFYGVTSIDHVTDSPDYNNTQKSYGFWAVPPDIGTKVIVIFVEGPPRIGFWIGCVQDKSMNFMVPGNAATKYAMEKETDKERVPVAEYNKKIQTSVQDVTKYEKPATPQEKQTEDQGLLKDDIRGITSSSARREVPSMVFGISTPGPIDKQGGAKQGDIGKYEHRIKGAFVSRLGGSSFVMDDGDDKFIRKKKPWEGPMEYSAVEQGETDGEVTIPHNELVRLRTRTGHQILMHNSEDLIYISNSRGTAWIELTSDGKMDVYCEDSINFRTKQDFNMIIDRDFNLEVGRNFNVKVNGERHTNVLKDDILIVDRDQKIHVKRRRDETIDEQLRQTVHDDVKKVFTKDYTHNVNGRMDFRIADGLSFTAGNGPTEPKFAPYDSRVEQADDPVANDDETSVPVEDHNGPTPDRIDVKIYKDTRIEHIGVSVDHTVDVDYKLKVKSNYDTNVGGHIFMTSGASNETKAGGNIIETAPEIHMNGPTAATAATAQLPEEARISAKGTIPLRLKMQKLPDMDKQDAESVTEVDRIAKRMPTPEPYPHHENLDPEKYKPTETDRDKDDIRYTVDPSETVDVIKEPAPKWREYSTATDTFEKVGPAAEG